MPRAVTAAAMGLADIAYPLIWLGFREHPAGPRLSPLTAVAPLRDADLEPRDLGVQLTATEGPTN